VVGNISDVYKVITEKAPEIPNFPIMLNVVLAGISDMSPANITVKHTHAEPNNSIATTTPRRQ